MFLCACHAYGSSVLLTVVSHFYRNAIAIPPKIRHSTTQAVRIQLTWQPQASTSSPRRVYEKLRHCYCSLPQRRHWVRPVLGKSCQRPQGGADGIRGGCGHGDSSNTGSG